MGGKVLIDPFEIEDFGVLTVLEDTDGAVFSAWEARGFRGIEFEGELEGAPDWIRLRTANFDKASSFYSHVFNWEIINNKTIVHNRVEIGEIQQNRALSRGARNLGHDVSHDGRKMIRISDPVGIVFSIIEKTR